MSDTSLVFNIIGRDQGANALISRTANNVRAANAVSAASTVALGAATISAGANLLAMGAAAAQLVGLVGLIPGAALGAAAALSVLKLATMNIGAALKTSTGGGASSAHNLADAEHRVETAQRRVIETQKALNDAREKATKDIASMRLELNRASLDEESASLAVAQAEKDLARAQRGGNANDIRDADLAYRESLQTLAEAKQRTADLTDEQKDQAAKGVEGSDEVQKALQAQKDAVYELAAAKRALADSGKGGGGGVDPAAAAFAKLSPEAQKLVTVLRQLTPQWTSLQKSVQDSVWKNVAGDVRNLSGVYLPILRTQLTGVGGAWNTVIRQAIGFAASAKGARDVNTMLSNVVKTSQTLALAVRPVISAIASIGAVGSQFLPGLAADVLRLSQRFEAWINAARNSGQMQAFISNAVVLLHQLAAIAWNVATSVAAIFRAAGAGDGQAMIGWLVTATASMSAFLNSAKGQERISHGLEVLRSIVQSVAAAIPALVQSGGGLSDTFSVAGVGVEFLAGHLDTLAKLMPVIAAGFVIYKTSQVAANAAAVARLPILAVQVVSQFALSRALKLHTAALRENMVATKLSTASTVTDTAATNLSIFAKIRNIAETVLLKAAELAGVAVRGLATAAQWLLNFAMSANPVGAIIMVIVILIGIIVLIATKTTWFQDLWHWAWGGIKAAALAVWHWLSDTLWPGIKKVWDYLANSVTSVCLWIHDKFQAVVNFLAAIPGNIARFAGRMWDGIKNSFKGMVNYLIGLWNRLDFGINIHVPDWVPGVGGKTFSIPDLIPDLPYLAKGGLATVGGMATVGENGPENVFLPAGATVRPLERGGGGGVVVLDIRGGGTKLDDLLIELLRNAIRARGGNAVRVLGG